MKALITFRKLIRYLLLFIGGMYMFGLAAYLIARLLIGDRLWPLNFLNNFAPFYFLPLIAIVPFMAFSRARRLLTLSGVLALIAMLWYGPYYLPKASSAPSGPAIKVLTFNVWGNNPRLNEIDKWIRQVNPDVVFLQEMWQERQSQLLQMLRDAYPNQVIIYDNAVIARYPLREEGAHRILLDIHGQTIALYNIHMPMPLGDRTRLDRVARRIDNPFVNMLFRYDDAARDEQISLLLKRLEHDPYPHIVAGDFNMSDQTAIYRELAVHLTDSFRERGIGYGASWPISDIAGLPGIVPPLVRIDYIWHSNHFRAVEVSQGPRLGSDHLPLYAALEIVGK